MSVCYNKLWKLLIDKNMNKTELRMASGITTTALAKLGVSIGHKALLYGCDGVERGGGVFYKLKE